MDASYQRHSRRSHPDLHNLAITPLSSSYPLPPTANDPHPSTTPTITQASSYLAGRSTPPVLSILSRSPSRTRHRNSKSALGLAALATLSSSPQAASSSTSRPPPARRSKSGAATPIARPRARESDSTDWLLQTASALVASSAESKGQAWLAARASSTSLEIDAAGVAGGAGAAAYHDPRDTPYRADDEFSPVSTRLVSRPGSRFASRANSRMNSRRGSRVGLAAEWSSLTPVESRTRGRGGDEHSPEVDFVDDDDNNDGEGWREHEEDGEVKRLVWGRAKGWVDWAVGWMDFREDEDAVDGEEDGHEEVDASQRGQVTETSKRRRKRRDESERILVGRVDGVPDDVNPPPADGQGALSDAAWLLGVAKNILV